MLADLGRQGSIGFSGVKGINRSTDGASADIVGRAVIAKQVSVSSAASRLNNLALRIDLDPDSNASSAGNDSDTPRDVVLQQSTAEEERIVVHLDLAAEEGREKLRHYFLVLWCVAARYSDPGFLEYHRTRRVQTKRRVNPKGSQRREDGSSDAAVSFSSR